MTEPFTVDVWSDVVCPFCYLGDRQLAEALDRFEHRAQVIVRRRAFELDPTASLHDGQSLDGLVARKYSISVERAHALHGRMEAQAGALGMQWSLATARPTNTFDAHRMIAFGSTMGLGDEVSERLFRAYFCEGVLVSDRSRLSDLAREVGLDGVDELWEGNAYVDLVRADEAAALELGVTGVPTFLLDSRFMVVGAQGPDHILDALQRAWARRAA